MYIRDYQQSDLPSLIDLTIEAFRPLFEEHLPAQLSSAVFDHDHGHWEADYRQGGPGFARPSSRPLHHCG